MFFSKKIALLIFLYFIQGLPYGFQARFMPIYLRSEGVSRTNIGFFKLLLAPWLCKALWAPFVDKYSTKHKWLLGSIFGLIITCASATLVTSKMFLPLCVVLFSLNFFAATQDIAVDGIALVILTSDQLGHGNTAQVVGYKIGSIFGGGILHWLEEFVGWKGLFIMMTALYVEAWMFVYISPSLRGLGMKTVAQCHANCSPIKEKKEVSEEILNNKSNEQKEGCIKRNISSISEKKIDNNSEDHHDTEKGKDEDKNSEEDSSSSNEQLVVGGDETSAKSSSKKESSCLRSALTMLLEVISVPGTKWMVVYVLIYKLGEQGAVGMMPIFLTDKGFHRSIVGFWTGIVGQGISILGSLLGGWFLESFPEFPTYLVLQQLSVVRLMPMGLLLWMVTLWTWESLPIGILYYGTIVGMSLMLLLSGIITVVTFTFMMQCSKGASYEIQATHYTLLASFEVFGKLSFMSVTGYLVDMFGYSAMYLAFTGLTALTLPWFWYCPDSLKFLYEDQKTVESNEVHNDGVKLKTQ